MKYILSLILLIFVSCQDDFRDTTSSLKVNVTLGNPITRSTISDFVNGDKIGVFVTYGTLSTPYFGVPSNAERTYNGTTWDASEPVYLTGKKGTVYAYYPFSASAGNGKSIPVSTASQTDYLYGVGDKQVNSEEFAVNIEMRHALTKVCFKIRKQDYAQRATLKSISITGSSAFPVYTNGTLNCETGRIITSGSNGVVSITCNDILQNVYGNISETLLFPMVSSTTSTGAISATFEIETDVKTERYKIDFPAPTFWDRGKSYIYPLTLNGYGLHINNTEVSILPWGNTLTGNGSTM